MKKKNKYLIFFYFIEKQDYFERIQHTITIPFKPITTEDALLSTDAFLYQRQSCCK